MSIRPTFYGIQIGYSGLQTSQKGLDVTGHNIANVDTLGYTRQRIVQTAYNPYNATVQWRPVDKALVGSGTSVLIHDQIRSSYLDQQFRTEQSLYSTHAVHTDGLTYIRNLFEGSDASNLTANVYDLFAAFNDNTKEAHDREFRENILSAGLTLTTSVKLIYQKLMEQQEGRDKAVAATVEQINTLVEEITALNEAIYKHETNGLVANDLRDRRNLALDNLSALADIKYEYYVEDGDHFANTKLKVYMGGELLLDHKNGNELTCVKTPNVIPGEPDVNTPVWASSVEYTQSLNPDYDPNKADPSHADYDEDYDVPEFIETLTAYTPLKIQGGELEGHIIVRDGTEKTTAGIPYFMEIANNLIRALVSEINAVHREGYTHPLSGDESKQGVNFFWQPDDLEDLNMGNFKLDDLITQKNGIYNIASSDSKIVEDPEDPNKYKAGNQENAKNIFAILEKQSIVINVGGEDITIGGIESFMTGLYTEIALTLQRSKNETGTKASVLSNVDQSRTSISGVSLDEEMTNIMKYQHAFNGASRVITTMDEAIETIINRMGRVGL